MNPRGPLCPENEKERGGEVTKINTDRHGCFKKTKGNETIGIK